MTTLPDGRTLPWRILGRAVRPYTLAVSLATSVSVWSVSTDRAVGQLLDGLPGAIIAAYEQMVKTMLRDLVIADDIQTAREAANVLIRDAEEAARDNLDNV